MDLNKRFALRTRYHSLENDEGMILLINAKSLSNELELTSTLKYVLFILDISGSMSGSILETCKETLKKMFAYLHNELNNKNIDLILFNNNATLVELKNKPLKYCIDKISSITAQGGTAFIPVFNCIKDVILKSNGDMDNVCIIMLSDGQAESLNVLEEPLSQLRLFFQENTQSCETHTLGFGSLHDAKVLSAVTGVGTSQGTFQYIKSVSEIQIAIDSVAGFFG